MIGIDISDRSVKVIRLANRRNRKLLNHSWQSVPSQVIEKGVIVDTVAMKTVLEKTFAQSRLDPQADGVVASIPETQSFLRVIEIPVMDEREISEAVQWEVAQHIPFGLENVYIDWQPIESGHTPASGRREVLVGAAEKSVVDPLLAVLRTMHMNVVALELESQAIVRALISRELQRRKGLLLVDLGGAATNVIVFDHSTIRFTASLQKGSSDLIQGLPSHERALVDGPPKEPTAEQLAQIGQKIMTAEEELVLEIQGIVEFYNGIDTEHEVHEIVLTGGGANLPDFDRAVLKYFDNVHIHRGNPWVNILPVGKETRPPFSLQESVHYSTALGLALRNVVI